MTTEELVIKLSADNSDLRKKLDQSKSDVSGFGSAINKMGGMAMAAYAGMGVAAVKFAKDSFIAFEAQEKANKRLLFALKGNTQEFDLLSRQAAKFQSTTGIADDAIQGIQTLGAQAGKTRQEIENITEATINWSSLTGQDLQSAYMQINGTLNGTAGRLTRVDSQFGTLTETQLKNGAAIDLINTKYKDFAANSATSLEKLNANWEEFKENAGSLLADVINPLFAALNDGINNINRSEGFWQKLGSFAMMGAGNPALQAVWGSSLDAQGMAKDAVSSPVTGATYNATGALGLLQDMAAAQDEWNKSRLKSVDIAAEAKKAEEAYWSVIKVLSEDLRPDTGMDQMYIDAMNARSGSGYMGAGLAPGMGQASSKAIWSNKGTALTPRASGGTAFSGAQSVEQLKEMNSQLRDMQTLSMAGVDAFGAMGEALGTMAATGEMSFKGMVQAMLGGIRQVIQARLAEAMAGQASSNAKFGIPGLAMALVGIAGIQAIFANLPKFAGGGIVGGGYFSGDSITARVNSGEMILNASQQAQLFAIANGKAGGAVQVYGVLRGSDLELATRRGKLINAKRGL